MEPPTHFLFAFLIGFLIGLLMKFNFILILEWATLAALLGVLYDADHLMWGLIWKKITISEIIQNPKVILRIRRKTGILPSVPTHNLFIAILLTLLSAVVIPKWAIPTGIGLVSHILLDEGHNWYKVWRKK